VAWAAIFKKPVGLGGGGGGAPPPPPPPAPRIIEMIRFYDSG
jgi:hypothetical protein